MYVIDKNSHPKVKEISLLLTIKLYKYMLIWLLIDTSTDKESIAKPRLEESIVLSLIDVNVAAQDEFDVTGVIQKDHKTRSNPQLHYSVDIKRRTLFYYFPKYICNKMLRLKNNFVKKRC